jgi:hypothetical protein
MPKPTSIRQRWKRHEREVAKFFGTVRNVHGRGEEGITGSDVVADLAKWDTPAAHEFYTDGPYSHIFIECKYTYGTESMPFRVMTTAKEGTAAKDVPFVTIWGPYLLIYLDDLDKLLVDHYCPSDNFLGALIKYGVYRCNRQVPKYMDKWWEQVTDDVKAQEDKEEIKAVFPIVCLGNSSRKKIALFKVRQNEEREDSSST